MRFIASTPATTARAGVGGDGPATTSGCTSGVDFLPHRHVQQLGVRHTAMIGLVPVAEKWQNHPYAQESCQRRG
jgi:hypothetical protein